MKKAQKYNVTNFFTNLSSLLTYDSTGYVDYTDKLDNFNDAYGSAEYNAGEILSLDLQDRDFRSAFNIFGWKPKGDPQAMALEWYEMDYKYAQIPDVCSQEFTVANFVSFAHAMHF